MVTKYLMRSPGIRSAAPGDHLPKPPANVVVTTLGFPWEHLDLATFTRLVRNFSGWHERNNSPSTNRLSANLLLRSAASGAAGMVVQVDAAATDVLTDFLADIREGLGFTPLVIESRTLPWLHATRYLGTNTPFLTDPTARAEHKAAYLRRTWDESQITAVHHHLSNPPADNPNAMVVLLGFGGQVNTVRPADTAVAQRDSVLKALFQAFWADETDDAAHLKWVRDLYRDVHATTGGVPVPGPAVDGCYINYPDVDLNDPTFNTSGVPWHDLYYKENYPRLQQVKAGCDPLNVFHHTQSIRLPGH